MVDKLDCVVAGAGVVGLAVARALALAGREVIVLEGESQIGMHTSSRNSEVIHAGIYYPENSLKARLCVQGRGMLYRYCETHHVAHERIGKLIVAVEPGEVDTLHFIERQARRNGVNDLRFLDAAEMAALEPNVISHSALLSPSTGIIDTHELMTSFQGEIEEAGGAVLLNSRVSDLSPTGNGLRFRTGGDAFECMTFVNSAGLWAQELVVDIDRALGRAPTRHLAKGHYYAYQGKSPFRRLVYPVPVSGGLGIHATLDLGGSTRFGPDVMWIDSIDYKFDDGRKPEFVESIRRYFPDLDEDRLQPSYTGIRPKLAGPGEPAADFLIESDSDHGVTGLINLFGIESPGLTAALAIGEYVAAMNP